MHFVTVLVEEHEALPEGCVLRFRAQDAGRPIRRVAWESEDAIGGIWTVEGASADGGRSTATAYLVDDSSAGTSLLVVGGDHGLRLTRDGASVAMPYLLVDPESAVDDDQR